MFVTSILQAIIRRLSQLALVSAGALAAFVTWDYAQHKQDRGPGYTVGAHLASLKNRYANEIELARGYMDHAAVAATDAAQASYELVQDSAALDLSGGESKVISFADLDFNGAAPAKDAEKTAVQATELSYAPDVSPFPKARTLRQ